MAILKADRQKEIANKLTEKIGRPAANGKEERLLAGTSAVLSGNATYADAQRMYAVSNAEIRRFIEQVFPTEEDKYTFLEECMVSNAMLASSRFQQSFSELTAIDAARAASIFAGKAIEIRKAKETGFKEPPLRVDVIVALEKTLRNLSDAKTPTHETLQ